MAGMTVDMVDLSDIRTLGHLLSRLPQGEAARLLGTRLGVWTPTVHDGVASRKQPYLTEYSSLTESELSDRYAYWMSEVGRSTELAGLFEGLKKLVELLGKQHRAAARAKIRRQLAQEEAAAIEKGQKPAKPTAVLINDLAEEDEEVRAIEQVAGLLAVTHPSVTAYKEACLAQTTGLSREITLRTAQMQARLR